MSLNRFIQGGRLTDCHKNNIDTHELLNKLHKAAKEKIYESSNKTNHKTKEQSYTKL